MPVTPEDLVRREVHYCVSGLVATLAGAYGELPLSSRTELGETLEQAYDLAAPIDDWEEAATQLGYSPLPDGHWMSKTVLPVYAASARDACEAHGEEPYQRDVYEHWLVSDWLADKLIEEGEKVDKDFAGLTVWARTTTGQAISMDSVIERIAAKLNAPEAEG